MPDGPTPRLRGLLLAAAFLTLLATGLRLVGELQGWDPRWFSSEVGGRSWFGILWLAPLCGGLIGARLARTRGKPSFAASFWVPLTGVAMLFAAILYVSSHFEGTELARNLRYVCIGGPALLVLGVAVWPRATFAMLGYAVLARVPVLVVTYLDLHNGWQTHYGRVLPKLPPFSVDERLWLLASLQGGFWVPVTILLGVAGAALGAASVRSS